jgi:hypothetical protein
MTMLKIAVTLSFFGALSLIYNERAQSAPLSGLSATAKPGAQQISPLQVRWRHGWHRGASGAPPQFYGGTYLGHPYGGFPGSDGYGYVFPTYRNGYRPLGWWWFR